MVLIMNLLKSKKIDRPRMKMKDMDFDIEGSDSKDVSNENPEDDEEDWTMNKKSTLGGSSSRKRKEWGFDKNIDDESTGEGREKKERD